MAVALTPPAESFFASRSAPCLVRAKTRNEPCFGFEQAAQQAEFAVLFDFIEMHFDAVGGPGGGTHGDAHRVLHVFADQTLRAAFESGGEEHRLASRRGLAQNAFDGGQKAHVEHAVGFVENDDANGFERDQFAVEKIAEPSRRRDHDLRAAAQRL